MKLYTAAAMKIKRRDTANQVRAVSLAIAQAFGADINPTLQELDD